MGDSPAAVLYDADGNPITNVVDGSLRRLHVQASLKPGSSINIGSPAPSDLTTVIRDRLKDAGSPDMLVDGEATPVEFTYDADSTDDISLFELRFLLVANSIKVEGNKFGPINELTNGVKLDVRSNDQTTTLFVATITEEFLMFPTPSLFVDRSGTKDVLAVSYSFGGAAKLLAGSGDFVKVTIQDDLTSPQFVYFQAALSAVKG